MFTRRRDGDDRGFTMIELMVVVVVVGVLAAIAVPIYGGYARNARITEAHGRMGEVVTASKAFACGHVDASGRPQWPPVNGNWGVVELSATENFTYEITSGMGATADDTPLEITATGRNKMSGVTVRITVADLTAVGSPPEISGF